MVQRLCCFLVVFLLMFSEGAFGQKNYLEAQGDKSVQAPSVSRCGYCGCYSSMYMNVVIDAKASERFKTAN